MSNKRNKNYIDDFKEAQNNQYTPWKHLANNQPIPYYEAKGSPKLMGIAFGLGAVFMGFGALVVYRWGNSTAGFITVLIAAIFFAGVSVGYFRKNRARKEYAKRQAQIRKSQRSKKGKTRNKHN